MTDEEAWREHIDRELKHQSEKFGLKLDALLALWKEQNLGLRRALKLQAKEYERRLLTLNHEAERLKAAAALSVAREKYDADRKGDQEATEIAATALKTAKDEADAKMADLRDQMRTDVDTRAGAAASRADLKSYIAIAIAVISLILKFLPIGGTP